MPKLKKDKPLESTVKAAIKAQLDEHGWFWWNVPMNAYAKAGISDIHAVKDGMFMVIEAKREAKDEPTIMQKAFLGTIASHSHFAFVVDVTTVGDLVVFLDCLNRATAAQVKGEMPSPDDGAAMVNCLQKLTSKY